MKAFEAFRDKPWATCRCYENIHDKVWSHAEYIRALREHQFVIAPEGNGIDTHRIWEALYVGTIPIVKRHPALRWFEEWPILFVDSWREVTEEHLSLEKIWARERHELASQALWIDYWERRINDARDRFIRA
jgi:hypothetical protein